MIRCHFRRGLLPAALRRSERSTATVLAVASGGGHWLQMMQIMPAFDGLSAVHFATTDPNMAQLNAVDHLHVLADYSQSNPLRVAAGLWQTGLLVWRLCPAVVISTGAAPGLLCIFWGRIVGARTIWLDSIANAERLSLSGRLASRIASVTFTQWQSLSDGKRIHYAGSVL